MTASLPESQHSTPKNSNVSKAPPVNSKQAVEIWLRSIYLSAEDGKCGVPLSVRDFINYLRHETPATADFTTEMLDWALETIERPSDTIIVPVTISQTLYGIGTGNLQDDSSKILQQQYPEYCKALKGKRYVFLPVNNGFASEFNQQLDVQISRPGRGKPKSQDHATTPRFGGHWSFIVIDTQSSTASYIDDRVKAQTLNGKRYQISRIEMNGAIAGRVLYGFDTLMQLKRGQLKTNTLKWVPGQSARSQQNRPDAGSCGPYVWKMIDFIIANRTHTLSAGGLKGYFSEKQKKRLNFDSYEARRQIQQQLQLKRERKEASNNLYPYNLTASTISELATPEFLRQVFSGNNLKALLDKYELPEEAEDVDANIDGQAAALAFWEKQKAMQSKSKKDPTDWSQYEKQLFWKTVYPTMNWEDALRLIDKHIQNPGEVQHPTVDEAWRKRWDYAIQRGIISEELGLSNHHFYDLIWTRNRQLREEYNVANSLEPDHPDPEPPVKEPKTRGKKFLTGFGPDKLPNFATETNLEPWFELNKDLWEAWIVAPEVKRALLHRTYKGSFKTESEEDLKGFWSQDSRAFNKDERSASGGSWTSGDIAQRMDDTYVDLEVPLFANLPEDEVEIWTRYLPDYLKTIVMVDDSKSSDRTRGLLHRLFVGEFEELRAQGDKNSQKNIELLEAWRTHDPRCSKTDFPTVDAAVDQLKMLYDVQETSYLPFLRESPLSWPPQDSLERGKKRKRDDDESGGSPGEAPKKPKITKSTIPMSVKKLPKVTKNGRKIGRPGMRYLGQDGTP